MTQPRKKKWRKVSAAKRWRPEVGEVLEGVYVRRKDSDGKFGPYTYYVIRTDNGLWSVSGFSADSLFSAVETGDCVQLVCHEITTFETPDGDTREVRHYELYVEEDEA